ncbi:hypothetical protein Adt_06101 [Abeliophyllum distichum]|uniref:Uncharacterized protein n=1 Tax=Abeliophyllum distichum TaxID=126358 RepID=A0ABD1V5Z3_9LAMI
MKLELEKIKAERADAEARTVEAYQDAFVDTPEYQDLTQHMMTVGGEQLVERIMEAHPEWDLSFLREAPAKAQIPVEETKALLVPTFEEAAGQLFMFLSFSL